MAVLKCTHNLWFEQKSMFRAKIRKIKKMLLKIFNFYNLRKNLYIIWACFCNDIETEYVTEEHSDQALYCRTIWPNMIWLNLWLFSIYVLFFILFLQSRQDNCCVFTMITDVAISVGRYRAFTFIVFLHFTI